MRILVICQSYPDDNNPYRMMYVHSRSLEYLNKGIELAVLSFSADSSYCFEGVNVLTENDVKLQGGQFDLVVSHAPNLKNHFRFLLTRNFKNIVFIIHGHEVLRTKNYYPNDYSQNSSLLSYCRNLLQHMVSDVYDAFKIFFFNQFVLRYKARIGFIFVSEWMREHYEKNVGVLPSNTPFSIIPNCVNNIFTKNSWLQSAEKEYDFVSIRPLSGKKYAVDVICSLARKYPNFKFLLYGKGKYFDFNELPSNVTWINQFLLPHEIPNILDKARCALMPTRLDSQGVMMCEMVTYGIPLITSNIQVCRTVFKNADKVSFIDNDNPELPEKLDFSKQGILLDFFPDNIAKQEIDFFDQVRCL